MRWDAVRSRADVWRCEVWMAWALRIHPASSASVTNTADEGGRTHSLALLISSPSPFKAPNKASFFPPAFPRLFSNPPALFLSLASFSTTNVSCVRSSLEILLKCLMSASCRAEAVEEMFFECLVDTEESEEKS